MPNNNNLDDLNLIQKVKDGDRMAFTELVRRHEQAVAATVIGMLGMGEDAEDIGQNVFIRFYNSIDAFRGEAALSTYLTRIAINLSLNELKRRKRRNMFFVSKREGDEVMDLRDENNTVDAQDTEEVVNIALQQLEPKFRSVVVLRMLQGFSTKETANILKLPVGTVLSRLARAQDKLKDILKNLMD